MSKRAHVVDGEASESESDIEVGKIPDLQQSPSSEPFVIVGEAPESDDESKIPALPLAQSDAPQPIEGRSTREHLMKTNYSSLLHQKLWECNISLRATVEGLLRHTTAISVEKLSRADKTLLTVQESMRATNANMTLARARLKLMQTGLQNANCAAALSTVRC